MRWFSHALLAIAVAAGAIAAAVIDAGLVRPWRVHRLGELYAVGGLSWPPDQDRVEFWSRVPAFAPLIYAETGPQRARVGDRQLVLDAVRASDGLLALLQAPTIAGRTLVPGDYAAGSRPVALVSPAFAARAFQSPEHAVGATLHILGGERQIVGVTAATATYRSPVDVWIPRTPDPSAPQYPPAFRRDEWIGVLRPGTSIATAHEQLVGLQKELRVRSTDANLRFDGVIVIRPLMTDLIVRRGPTSTFAGFASGAFALLVFSWIGVLRAPRRPASSGDVAPPDGSRASGGWRLILRHPLTQALPAIGVGGIAGWVWERQAVARWLPDLLPPSVGAVELAGRGGSALVAAAAAVLLGLVVFGCAAIVRLRQRPDPVVAFGGASVGRSIGAD